MRSSGSATNKSEKLRSLSNMDDENWGKFVRGKPASRSNGAAAGREVEPAPMMISTPKLCTVNLLTQNPSSTAYLGDKSEMAKAKRVESAMEFWLNQKSFRLSPVKELKDAVNENIDSFPAEMRRALASGVVHTVRSDAATNKRRQLQSIFSEEEMEVMPAKEPAAEASASSSISFSASECGTIDESK